MNLYKGRDFAMGVGNKDTMRMADGDAVKFALGQTIAVGLRILGADEGSMLVAEAGGKTLRFAIVADRDGTMPESAESSGLIGKCVPVGEGVTGMAALMHDVQTAADADDAGIPFHRVRGDRNPHAVLAAPVLVGDRLVGVITAVSFVRRKTFSPSQAQTYGMLANVAAGIIEAQRQIDGDGIESASRKSGVGAASLLREVNSFARKHPCRIEALRRIVAALDALQ